MIEIFKQFYFRVVAKNGEVLSVSEGYTTKQNCLKGINSLKENLNEVIDITWNI
jgi:uncharacterized protein